MIIARDPVLVFDPVAWALVFTFEAVVAMTGTKVIVEATTTTFPVVTYTAGGTNEYGTAEAEATTSPAIKED